MGFEPTISAGERPQNYALDRAATGTGTQRHSSVQIKFTADTFLCYQPFALFPVELADNSLLYMTLLWTSGNK